MYVVPFWLKEVRFNRSTEELESGIIYFTNDDIEISPDDLHWRGVNNECEMYIDEFITVLPFEV